MAFLFCLQKFYQWEWSVRITFYFCLDYKYSFAGARHTTCPDNLSKYNMLNIGWEKHFHPCRLPPTFHEWNWCQRLSSQLSPVKIHWFVHLMYSIMYSCWEGISELILFANCRILKSISALCGGWDEIKSDEAVFCLPPFWGFNCLNTSIILF